jgi:branched-chain amino acid transport system permease protein
MTEFVQYGVDAISQGAIFALIALSLGLLFSVMGLMNFAYGELIMAGAYTMYYTRDLPWPLMILAVIAVTTIVSVVLERTAFRPVRNASPATLLVTSFAVSIALQQIAQMAFGSIAKGIQPFGALDSAIVINSVRIPRVDVLTVVVAGVVIAGLSLMLRRSDLGIQLRASTEDFTMARVLGVNANRVIVVAFALTGALAGIVALLLTVRNGIASPTVGTDPVLIAFVGAVIGGMGSIWGAAVGGFALGAAETILQASLPTAVDPFTNAIAFAAVIAILVTRPGGLVSRAQEVRV